MSYYQVLGLVREPFSNSPDPELLYRSKTHLECLQHMEIAVRLRRGLNVVLGEVGTGKTTLGRALARILVEDPDFDVYFLDDPYFPDAEAFLAALARLFGLETAGLERDQGRLREAIKAELLRRGGDGRHIVTLIVDEGQKITGECLELLRELLNFETSSHKLLQIVMFAQQEFDAVLTARPNLDDRVNFRYELRPLNRQQTRRMIEARLNLCAPDGRGPRLFTDLAFRRIHRLTGGYPRKIVRLCHMAMLLAVGQGRHRIDWGLVGRAAREMRGSGRGVWLRRLAVAGAFAGLLGTLAVTSLGIESALRRQRQAAVANVATTAEALPPQTTEAKQLLAILDEESSTASLEHESAETLEATAAMARTPAPLHEVRSQAVTPPVREQTSVAAAPRLSGPELLPSHGKNEEQAAGTVGVVGAPEVALTEEEAIVVATDQPPAQAPAVVNKAETAPAEAATESVVAETAAVNVVAEAAAEASPLAVLGEATTRPGSTVSRQALLVYGNSGRAIVNQLAKANPNIDCERIRAGQTLTFPAIAASAPPRGARILSLGTVDSLEKGLTRIDNLKQAPLPLILFVTHEPGNGLRFQVVAYALYGDTATARAALASLPPTLAATSRVVEHFPQGTMFYTDMSQAGGKRNQPKTFTPTPFRRQVAATETR